MKIGIVGLGFVGGAMKKSFEINKVNVIGYDKYKDSDPFVDLFTCDILFLSLPTVYNKTLKEYNKSAIVETLKKLENRKYNGLVVIKSTVEPETTLKYSKKYRLNLCHNPEFLSASTCFQDFHNQKHIVLGKAPNCCGFELLVNFYKSIYPKAKISCCTSNESESMKIFVNCFYASKVQFFNELYLLCQSNGTDYNIVRELMFKNGWINPMHTKVPYDNGTGESLSFSGFCFPKDCNALLQYMKRQKTRHQVLDAVLQERNEMRKDDDNLEE